jgi:uncharacterized membrane protein YidH (DUF202 family)
MSDDNLKLKIDLYKQQIDRQWTWSQFYHDAEIRVNTSSIVVSALGVIGNSFSEKFKFSIPYFDVPVNMIGVLIVISSSAAIVSTIGYWRYYELCDIYAKKFRKAAFCECGIEQKLEYVKKDVDSEFQKAYPIFHRKEFEDAHHAVWVVTQLALLLVGVFLILA